MTAREAFDAFADSLPVVNGTVLYEPPSMRICATCGHKASDHGDRAVVACAPDTTAPTGITNSGQRIPASVERCRCTGYVGGAV